MNTKTVMKSHKISMCALTLLTLHMTNHNFSIYVQTLLLTY